MGCHTLLIITRARARALARTSIRTHLSLRAHATRCTPLRYLIFSAPVTYHTNTAHTCNRAPSLPPPYSPSLLLCYRIHPPPPPRIPSSPSSAVSARPAHRPSSPTFNSLSPSSPSALLSSSRSFVPPSCPYFSTSLFLHAPETFSLPPLERVAYREIRERHWRNSDR